MSPIFHNFPETIRIHTAHVGLDSIVVLCYHVQYHQVQPAIIVNIGGIHAHTKIGDMPHGTFQLVTKGTIAIVYIEEIGRRKIVGHIKVSPPVIIQITGGYAVGVSCLFHTSFTGYIGKGLVSIISIQSRRVVRSWFYVV